MKKRIEYPIYCLYAKNKVWTLVEHLMPYTFSEVRKIACDILNRNQTYDAIRIYGGFNKRMTFIEEIVRGYETKYETIPDIYNCLMSLCKGHERYPHDTVKIRGFPISYNDIKQLAKRIKKAYEREKNG